jgi:hypothetical protein
VFSSFVLVNADSKQTQMIRSPPVSGCQNEPTIKRRRPAFTTSAGLQPEIGGRPLDHITQPHLIIDNESWYAQRMRRNLRLICLIAVRPGGIIL